MEPNGASLDAQLFFRNKGEASGFKLLLRVAELRLTPGYLDDPDYAALLRTVYDEASDALHFGFKQFHACFLIEAYVHQRRYKDALQISQEIGMFSESRLFRSS